MGYYTALSATGATGNITGGDMDNTMGHATGIFFVDVTTITGSSVPTMTFTVEGKDEASGKYYTLLASVGISVTSTVIMRICPDITAATNLIAQDVMPSVFRVKMVKANTLTNGTFTVGCNLVD